MCLEIFLYFLRCTFLLYIINNKIESFRIWWSVDDEIKKKNRDSERERERENAGLYVIFNIKSPLRLRKAKKDAKIIASGLLRYYAIIFAGRSFYRCSENPDKRRGKKPGRSRVVGGQLTLMKRSVPTWCLKTKRAEIVDKLRAKGAYAS